MDGPANGAYIILPRERLFGIGGRVIYGRTGVQGCGSLVEAQYSVPFVGPVLGGDDDRAASRARGIGVFLGSAHRKFLDGVGRETLQEAANVVIGIVATIY